MDKVISIKTVSPNMVVRLLEEGKTLYVDMNNCLHDALYKKKSTSLLNKYQQGEWTVISYINYAHLTKGQWSIYKD